MPDSLAVEGVRRVKALVRAEHRRREVQLCSRLLSGCRGIRAHLAFRRAAGASADRGGRTEHRADLAADRGCARRDVESVRALLNRSREHRRERGARRRHHRAALGRASRQSRHRRSADPRRARTRTPPTMSAPRRCIWRARTAARRWSSGCWRPAPMRTPALLNGETVLMTCARTGERSSEGAAGSRRRCEREGARARSDGADVGRGARAIRMSSGC